MLGEPGVGKTSLVARYVYNIFDEKYISTVGARIVSKNIDIEHEGKKWRVNLVIWDIAGQQSFESLQPNFFKSAEAALLVCDASSDDSLKKLGKWYYNFKEKTGAKIYHIIVNKIDLEEITVKEDDVCRLSNEFDADYTLTSAKTGKNVSIPFLSIAKKFIQIQRT